MKYGRETDELIFLYFRFVHKSFNQDHGKTTTQKISNAIVHLNRHWFLDSTLVVCGINIELSLSCYSTVR